MAFDKAYLKLKNQNPRGIPDEYTYWGRDDSIATITTSGYFSAGDFDAKQDPRGILKDPPDTSEVLIHVSCADGSYQVSYDVVSGVVSVVSAQPSSDVVYTAGTGGDFTNADDALKLIMKKGKGYYGENPLVELRLLTGFQLDKSIIFDGINGGFITITSDDAEVTIDRSGLVATNIPNLDYNSTPAFLAVNGGTLPTVGALFSMDTSGSADSAKQHGVMAAWGGHVNVSYGCGVKNATGRGLYLVNASGYARNSVWDGAGTRGIRAGNGSLLNVRGASATGCGEYGLAMGGASLVTASGLDVSGCLNTGILVDNGSQLNADSVVASGCATNGMDVKFGSTVNVYAGDFSNSGARAVDITSSLVEMENANCSNAGSTPIVINKGSNVNAQNVTATTTGNTVAVSCTASRLNFKNGTASSTGAQPIRVFDGAMIVAVGSTGGFNVAANTVTVNGIIFK